MKTLYRVTVEFEMVVEAEDQDEAREIALRYAPEAVRECKPLVLVGSKIEAESDLPEHWDDLCLPYGGDGNQRIKDIIKETA